MFFDLYSIYNIKPVFLALILLSNNYSISRTRAFCLLLSIKDPIINAQSIAIDSFSLKYEANSK